MMKYNINDIYDVLLMLIWLVIVVLIIIPCFIIFALIILTVGIHSLISITIKQLRKTYLMHNVKILIIELIIWAGIPAVFIWSVYLFGSMIYGR